MLGDITQARDIYIACGYTDMRKSIDGIAAIVQQQFQLDPFARDLFLFCGRKRDRIKALLWEGDIAIHSRQPEDNPACTGQLRMSPLQTYGQSVHRSPESTGSGAEPFACFPFHRR